MRITKTSKTSPSTSWFGLFFIAACSLGLAYWTQLAAQEANIAYANVLDTTADQTSIVTKIEGDASSMNIPAWSWFREGQIWEYIEKSAPRQKAIEGALIESPVKASKEGGMRVDVRMKSSLIEMFQVAEAEGVPLMLSSAYRSRDDQQNLYDFYLALQGRAYVDSYVAKPGASEHETGLAIDVSSESPDCLNDSDKCNLHPDSISWLSENATRFGFLQRYPSGKQSITGVAGEAWHYRYIGRTLAEFLERENLTFDEFVRQVAPGYAK
ncbi:D-alanyl-D-alanine carboxypeptidase family protein [Candidatus Saccharibacteria bacterium]|nr:D-alanyl-D-alanine carboxypeptidase family protein [Candidatus Saccharibacteria bacterium]